MKNSRAFKIAAIVFCGLIVLLLIACITILSLGYRFTSKGAAGSTLADNPVIHTDDYDFYCINFDMADGGEKIGEVIIDICPVQKFGVLYKAIDYAFFPVMIKGSENSVVGNLVSLQGEDGYHNFFFRYILQDELLYDYDSVTVNGTEAEIYNYSYFETAEKVTEFSLEGKNLVVIYDR